ncbi:S8 family serine peptidase [Methanoregula sp.]|uniref:S8 family serine peptidase n=1 Tax=Methanoregula sp. TaxID=2052170 RepID=UPI003C72CFA8
MMKPYRHSAHRILFILSIFFSVVFVMGICAPANAGPPPAYVAHPAITNISSQNTDSGRVSQVTHTESISNAKPVTFTNDPVTKRSYVSNHIIVRFKSRNDSGLSVSADKIQMAHAKVGAKVLKDFSAGGLTGMQLVQLNGTDVQTAIKEYQSDPNVLYAEPDYEISITRDETGPAVLSTGPLQIASIPNDPGFSLQWALHNTGQDVENTPGTPGADINATPAWGISTGSNTVIVAVIDTGVNYTLPDLSPNIWTNPVDGSHGWNYIAGTNNPLDDYGHGTDCAGILGAVGNNGIGIAGVDWHVQVMALKAFDSSGNGLDSNAIAAIQYADAHGASVISNSWSGTVSDQAMEDAIAASPAVVVSAAGNDASDNDNIPHYPASYPSANIISVAATDQNDNLASFSDYGPTSVNLAAPGLYIWGYGKYGEESYWSGTSMSTPFVSGVAALVKSINPNLTNVQIKNIILNNVDVLPSLSGKVSTGGRLDAYKAVRAAANTVVPPTVSGISPSSGPAAGGTVVTITGTSLTGATAVSFGATAATSFTVINATTITATAPAHAAGTVDVTVTTPGGVSPKSPAAQYTYTAAPTITTVIPLTWYRNATVSFLITGTNFEPGQTNLTFSYPSNGTALNSTIVVNTVTATTINGTVIVPFGAPTGTWNASVTTVDGGTVWKPSAFTVSNFPAPTITSVTYPPGNIGTTVLFTLTGTNFEPGETTVTIYNDITNTVLSPTVLSTTPTTIIGSIQIPGSAPAGAYNVNVTTADGGTASRPGSFTVGFVGIPAIASLTPVSGYQNTTVNFTVTGTNFEQGTGKTMVTFTNQTTGEILTPGFVNVTSPTQISAGITIPSGAATGPYRLDITTVDGGVVNKPNAFTVNVFPAPTITSVLPASAYLNSTISFTVTGTNFQMGSAMTRVNFTSGSFDNGNNITINSVTATSINGTMGIGPDAPPGKWNLTVTTINGKTSLVRISAMTVVQFPAPAITSITLATGTKNSTVLFTLAGTNFEPAGTSVTIVEDTSGTVLNATPISVTPGTIVGNVTIPATVPASLYRLQVTTKDGGTVSKLQAFTITSLPLPVMNTLTPASGYRNTTVPFTLTGNYFLNSGTTVMLRTVGTTIPATLTSVNTTTVQGRFAIPPGTAGTGSYTLYVITAGGGFNSKPGAFTVNPFPAPGIGAISPVSGYRNATVAFTLAGTNFEPGAITVTFLNQSANQSVAGQPPAVIEMDPTIFSVTSTQIVGNVSIPYNATLDLWKINVATVDGGTTSRPGAFTVR